MNNILSREEFIKVMDKMKKISDFESTIEDIYIQASYDMNTDIIAPMNPSLDSELIHVLNKMFYQKEDGYYTDIEYFIFELDYGRTCDSGIIKQDGKDIDLSDAGKLYDYLIEQMNDISEDDENDAETEE